MTDTKVLRRIAADLEKEASRNWEKNRTLTGELIADAQDLIVFANELDSYRTFFRKLNIISSQVQNNEQ